MKYDLFCWRKKCKFQHGRKKLIFDAQGDAYLSDGLSYASPSRHIQLYYADDLSVEEKLKRDFLRQEK